MNQMQNFDSGAAGGVAAGVMIVYFLVMIALYIYVAMALMEIAKRTNTDNGWFAFIPILNVILMLQIAQKPIWWIILFFVPIVNLVIGILVWVAILERRNYPTWWVILFILLPIVNLVLLGIVAWKDREAPAEAA